MSENEVSVKTTMPVVSMDKKEFKRQLRLIENDVEILKRIRKIQNELLSNCAYSHCNIEQQMQMFEKKKVPSWEREIIQQSYDIRRKKGTELFLQLESLLNEWDNIK